MRFSICLAFAQLLAANATGESLKGRSRPKRRLHSHLPAYETSEERARKNNKSKIARADNGERDAYMPISERAGDGTSYEYSVDENGVEVNVSVNVNVEVNTGNPPSGSMPKPPPEPAECAQWEISYITEIKPQYYYYQYYSSKSGKSSKSGGKSGKSTGKSGKSKSEKYMVKEVEMKKEVKTCVETRPPKVVTDAPSPSPVELPQTETPPPAEVVTPAPIDSGTIDGENRPTPSPIAEVRPTPIPTMGNISRDPSISSEESSTPTVVTDSPVVASTFPTPSGDVTPPPVLTQPPISPSPIGSVSAAPTFPTISDLPTLPPGSTPAPQIGSGDVPTSPPGTTPAPQSGTVTWDFEDGAFPVDPWTTGGDGEWAIDQSQVDGGIYSIKSPDLESIYNGTSLMSNATLTLDDSFSGGVLKMRVYASVQPPRDIFVVYIDGESAEQLVDTGEFSDVTLGVSPGPHTIDFSYQYNPFSIPELPESPATRLGAIWVDNVSIESMAPAPDARVGASEPKPIFV